MILVETRIDLRRALEEPRSRGDRIGLVPTMGYLHEGHLSLVSLARNESDFLAVSIFVNPLQFGPEEDMEAYPRDLDRDLALLEDRGVDLVFHPSVDEMYPLGSPLVTVDPGPMARVLCGAYRPGHFRGVLTVVARLFGLIRPHLAVFGRKDYQQGVLVRRMCRDLEMEVEVLMGPIVREADGLAMSSRNSYLDSREREEASGLHRALEKARAAFREGERGPESLRAVLEEELRAYPSLSLQYGEVVHPETLEPVDPVMPGSVMAVAAFCGRTRLIDNLILGA